MALVVTAELGLVLALALALGVKGREFVGLAALVLAIGAAVVAIFNIRSVWMLLCDCCLVWSWLS